jgi:hypothetical protein
VPNAARSFVASSIWGPWQPLANPTPGPPATAHNSQRTCILPVAAKKDAFLFLADRWNLSAFDQPQASATPTP